MDTPPRPLVIAIDGPSGSGKSSVAKGVATALDLDYLDTGAMYRAMTWYLIQQGVDLHDEAALAAASDRPRIDSTTDPAQPGITVDGVDVEQAIRGPEVTGAVSIVSAVPRVRQRLVELQRDEVRQSADTGRGIVAEGRDMGSVVLPDADLKVFLTADPAVRAARRAEQDVELGHGDADEAATEAELRRRDALDTSRATSPLTKAEGAVEVDASNLTLQETIDAVIALVPRAVGE